MKVPFRVHGLSTGSVNVPAQVDGQDMRASISCFEVELVTASDRDGNLILRFVGDSIEEAKKLFKQDGVYVAKFEQEGYEEEKKVA